MKKLGLCALAVVATAGLWGCPPLVVDDGTGEGGDGDQPGDGDGDGSPGCAAVTCLEGTMCVETPDGAECVPPLTCASVLCLEGTTCVETPEGPQCLPQDEITCASVLCIEGTVCIETPDGPECVPHEENPCNLVDCIPDTTCVVENGEAVCVPVPVDECADFMCPDGQHCELLYPPCAPPDEAGLVADRPECQPVPGCVENSTCDAVRCAEGTYCDDISGVAECLPLPTCEGVTCDEGLVCELVDVQCVRAPCPPQPECVPAQVGPCAVTLCPEDTYCDDISGEAECIPLPSCEGVECAEGTECRLVDVVCVRAPCPPQPSCEPSEDDPCARIDCKPGTHCELVEVTCVTEPCDPVPECVQDGWCGLH